MEGQVLGNRYEVIEKIGGGGMALVYKAKCRLLNRFVALKVLRPEFTNDEEFVKRFRMEAQSAASLSHPNVVSIYDVGNEGNVHYIVMEYVDGITLKEYISQKGALRWEEAINITIQICSAIEHAHKNHIIHRDIKPHNILLTKEGIAKVTDFGIARAVSASTITMVGSTIGSVHYFSPEQARGGFIDEKSDLYSLGITLYEMVTSSVPFNGDTPVVVALKHIQEEPKPPVEVNKNVPIGINDIVIKAIQKEQIKRYQSASDMLNDLYRALKDPNAKFTNNENNLNVATMRINTININSLTKKDGAIIEEKAKKEKKKNRVTVMLAIICAFIIIIPIGLYISYVLVTSFEPPSAESNSVIDDYKGRNIDDVKAELEGKGIKGVKEIRKYDDNIQKDIIISQSVDPGTKYKKGDYTSIELTVSDGLEMAKVPVVKNLDYREAEIELKDANLVVEKEYQFSESIGKDFIIRSDPDADVEIKAGETVTLYISKGPELKPVLIPDLTNLTYVEVQKKLSDLKLKVGKILPEGISSITAKIKSQSPMPGSLAKEDDPVDLVFEEVVIPQQKEVPFKLNLTNGQDYGDKIQVRVEIIPTDTNVITVLKDEEKNKKDFPYNISIPIKDNADTKVKVYYNDKLITVYTEQASGGQ
jgi:eukaryotic-like serine/threonine-protein kinase